MVSSTRKRKSRVKSKKSAKTVKKAKCSAASGDENGKDYSCYSDDALSKMKSLWNSRHPDAVIKSNNPKEIWKALRNSMRDVCDIETCWLRQKFMSHNLDKELVSYTFAPDAPATWKSNPTEWLTSVDIEKVMKQFEKKYKCFDFIGPSPIDFDKHMLYGECVWEELCKFDLQGLIRKGKTKVGIIFNLDPHYLEGSHWVSMFVNVKKGYIFFFDSNGDPAPKQVKDLADRIIKQGKGIGLNLDFYQNHPKEHQKGNTECGMYSLYLIIQLLTGTHNYEHFMNKRVSDDDMQSLRKEYFN